MYCLACFAETGTHRERCPNCGADLLAQGQADYADKLKQALSHPLADVRLRAIIALGLRQEAEAVAPLIACALRHPLDVIQGIEIARALKRIEDKHTDLEALSELARQHPSEIVKHAIAQLQARLPVCPYRGEAANERFPCAAAEEDWVSPDDCLACTIPEAITHPRACLYLLPVRYERQAHFVCRCYSTRGSVLSAKKWRLLCFCHFWFPRPKIERELAIPGLKPARQHALAVLSGKISGETPPPPGFAIDPCTEGNFWQRWRCRLKRYWQTWQVPR